MSETIKHSCGVFAITNHPEAANITYLGLYALQHRGQESAGIVSSLDDKVLKRMGMGRVADIFDEATLRDMHGDRAIGHVRYSTTGNSDLRNAQPIVVEYHDGWVAVAHNGNLVNTVEMRRELESQGSIFSSTTDSEILVHMLAQSKDSDFITALKNSLNKLRGAYSMVIMNDNYLIGLRDPLGIRPLSMGRLDQSVMFSSESCAMDMVGGDFVRTVEPGEMVIADRKGEVYSVRFAPVVQPRQCIFEFIYFSRPDSSIYGQNVYPVRKKIGMVLAEECETDADIVVPVPDSSIVAAIGYSEAKGLPIEWGLIRNHYIGRTFIEPTQRIRDFGARVKYNPVPGVLEGKRVVVVDDSIVRGTTMRKIVKMLRRAGAREVHLRISAPIWTHPCFYGIDTPERSQLIGATHSLHEIRKHLRVDTIHYISVEGLHRAVGSTGSEGGSYCDACFTGKYPIPFTKEDDQLQFIDKQGRVVDLYGERRTAI